MKLKPSSEVVALRARMRAGLSQNLCELIDELKWKDKWNLSSKKQTSQQLQQIFDTLSDTSHIQYLWLHWNEMHTLVHIVSSSTLTSLKLLNIGGNAIASIEPLQHAQMPNLEELWLWNNRITRVDALRKMHVPNLKFLDLSSNHLYSCSGLSQLGSPRFAKINVERNRLVSVLDFVRMPHCEFVVELVDNDLVNVLGKASRRGKKVASQARLTSRQVDYC